MSVQKKIFLTDLKEMFENMHNQTGWNMSGPMLWSYFFSNKEQIALDKLKEALIKDGYNFNGIHPSDKEPGKTPAFYWMQVVKEEAHTPESLDERNNEFYDMASKFTIDSYDGADVGAPPGEDIPDDQIPDFPEPEIK